MVVVVAVHRGDSRLCVAVVVLLYDCICAYGGCGLINEDAYAT